MAPDRGSRALTIRSTWTATQRDDNASEAAQQGREGRVHDVEERDEAMQADQEGECARRT